MYGVEPYASVRLAVVAEGLSHHEARRRFGIDRRMVKKMLDAQLCCARQPDPPGGWLNGLDERLLKSLVIVPSARGMVRPAAEFGARK